MKQLFKQKTWSLETIAGTGQGDIHYQVYGYEQDRDAVKINIKRNSSWRDDETHYWSVDLSTSTWGRDSKADRDQADRAYWQAIADASREAQALLGKFQQMESIFQVAEADRKRQAEIKAAEEKALYDADARVGEKLAKMIINTMKAEAKKNNEGGRHNGYHITLFSRGSRKETQLDIQKSWGGLLLFSRGYNRISKRDAIALLADSHMGSLKVDGCPGIVDPRMLNFMMGNRAGA